MIRLQGVFGKVTTTTIVSFLSGAGIISTFITFILRRFERKMDKREDDRIEESYLILTMLKALGHLAVATAIAQRDGKTNGEMSDALEYYTKAKECLDAHIIRKSVERTHAN